MSEIINPQDAELEEIILGSCLIESKAITLIADILRPEAFIMKKIWRFTLRYKVCIATDRK